MTDPIINGLILVLGSPNSDTGELYSIARERCRLALDEYARRDGWKLLPTGGYGAHFNTTHQPHAAYLKGYLTAGGIPEEDIVEFAESSNTIEDATLSKPIVLGYGVKHILVITSDYHEDRARYVFAKEFAGTGIEITFCIAQTDEAACELDLAELKRHEREALAKLKASAGYF
jgi:vancomycin permeability regulator SanA